MSAACATVDPAVFEAEDPWPATRVCLSCRELFACRWWAYNTDVAGVAGGVTEAQREQWRAVWNVTPATPPVAAFLDDRTAAAELVGPGIPASQHVLDVVASRTRAGQSAEQIAEALGITTRTVGRYRERYGPSLGVAS
jgi:hypothetical protein